jgi:hypothetical protein
MFDKKFVCVSMSRDEHWRNMQVICSRHGTVADIRRSREYNPMFMMLPEIERVALEYNGQGNGGTAFVLLACPCCDRDVFNPNTDIPKRTTLILSPILQIDTGELETSFKIWKMTRELPELNGNTWSDPIDKRNWVSDWRTMLKKAIEYPAA